MSTTYRHRIDWILTHRDFRSIKALADAAHVHHSTIGNLLDRERDGQAPTLTVTSGKKLASAANVNLEWLVTGKGSPEPDTSELALLEEAADLLTELHGLDAKDAWFLMRGLRVRSDNAIDYYKEAYKRLQAQAEQESQPADTRGGSSRIEAAERAELKRFRRGGKR